MSFQKKRHSAKKIFWAKPLPQSLEKAQAANYRYHAWTWSHYCYFAERRQLHVKEQKNACFLCYKALFSCLKCTFLRVFFYVEVHGIILAAY
jgi:hypothetical protein